MYRFPRKTILHQLTEQITFPPFSLENQNLQYVRHASAPDGHGSVCARLWHFAPKDEPASANRSTIPGMLSSKLVSARARLAHHRSNAEERSKECLALLADLSAASSATTLGELPFASQPDASQREEAGERTQILRDFDQSMDRIGDLLLERESFAQQLAEEKQSNETLTERNRALETRLENITATMQTTAQRHEELAGLLETLRKCQAEKRGFQDRIQELESEIKESTFHAKAARDLRLKLEKEIQTERARVAELEKITKSR
eukprot:scaffold1720_cov238-Pinguiococcus_pyrenoidosus.AAC.12